MTTFTQLTLSGEEAKEYMEYRTELYQLGFNSFEDFKIAKEEVKEYIRYSKHINAIENTLITRLEYTQYPGIEFEGQNFYGIDGVLIEFTNILSEILSLYVEGKDLSNNLKLELLSLFYHKPSNQNLEELLKEIIGYKETINQNQNIANKQTIEEVIDNSFTWQQLFKRK